MIKETRNNGQVYNGITLKQSVAVVTQETKYQVKHDVFLFDFVVVVVVVYKSLSLTRQKVNVCH